MLLHGSLAILPPHFFIFLTFKVQPVSQILKNRALLLILKCAIHKGKIEFWDFWSGWVFHRDFGNNLFVLCLDKSMNNHTLWEKCHHFHRSSFHGNILIRSQKKLLFLTRRHSREQYQLIFKGHKYPCPVMSSFISKSPGPAQTVLV